MTDRIFVIGDTIHFGPWVVGTIRTDIPATERDRFLKALDGNDDTVFSAGFDVGYREAVEDIAKGHG